MANDSSRMSRVVVRRALFFVTITFATAGVLGGFPTAGAAVSLSGASIGSTEPTPPTMASPSNGLAAAPPVRNPAPIDPHPPAIPATVAPVSVPVARGASMAAPGSDPQLPAPAPPSSSASPNPLGSTSVSPTRFVPTRACPSHVVAIAPDGTARCVMPTPTEQKAIDQILNRFGGLDNVLRIIGLPFTGADLERVLALATLAVGAGLALRGRRARRGALLFTERN